MNESLIHLASDRLSLDVSTQGAEMQNLADADGRSLQWDGDPAVWTGRAPVLFPVIGMLQHDRYRLDGHDYAMPKHGFARHALFAVVSQGDDAVTLRLESDAERRAAYPFEFRLDVRYALSGATLAVEATVTNRDVKSIPVSLGFHPAFRWPLPYDQPRDDHAIRFDHDEPAPIRRIDEHGFLTPDARPTPVVGDTLVLRDALFDDDAVIFDRLTGRAASYGASNGPRVVVRFDGFPMLGVWTKPGGARFICIEPWHGCADPVGFDGEIWDKPGIVSIAAGESRRFAMTITLEH